MKKFLVDAYFKAHNIERGLLSKTDIKQIQEYFCEHEWEAKGAVFRKCLHCDLLQKLPEVPKGPRGTTLLAQQLKDLEERIVKLEKKCSHL